MEIIELTTSNVEPLFINYFKGYNKNEKILIIVGGSGDDRNTFNNIVALLLASKQHYDVVTFSFRGVESANKFSARQQYYDLKELLDFLTIKRNKREIAIACTSMGAVSTTLVAIDTSYNRYLKEIIFIDPADYSEISNNEVESTVWTGKDRFDQRKAILSNKIKGISSDVKISVVNFLLRNYGDSGYVAHEQRGVDNNKLFSRLNNDMVKAFFTNTPDKNKGEYVEDRRIPHAFLRDGDITKNEQLVVELLIRLMH